MMAVMSKMRRCPSRKKMHCRGRPEPGYEMAGKRKVVMVMPALRIRREHDLEGNVGRYEIGAYM